jgi:hypothetical protein
MSNNPYASPAPLGDPANYGTPGKAIVPVAGVVLGILHMLYAVFTFVCNGFSGIFFFIDLPPEMTKGNAAVELMNISAFYLIYNQASLLLSLVAAVVLFVAGVLLLQGRPYGRKLSIYYCIYDFISITLSMIVNGILLFPMLFDQINDFPPGHPERLGAQFGLVGGLLGVVLSLIYPVVVIIFMYRPKMIEAYKVG